jgi:hypothetical protein
MQGAEWLAVSGRSKTPLALVLPVITGPATQRAVTAPLTMAAPVAARPVSEGDVVPPPPQATKDASAPALIINRKI